MTPSTRVRTSTTAASSKAAKVPEYIVVFNDKANSGANVLSRELNLKPLPGVALDGAAKLLESKRESDATPRVYERLGVAALDLSADEKTALESSDQVELIVENELRKVPPFFESTQDVRTSEAQVGASAGELFSLGFGMDDSPSTSIHAYACGLRDMAELFVRATEPRARDSRAFLLTTSPTLTWALQCIGIKEDYTRATGRGVKVAVIDTGVDLQHPDLRSKVTPNNQKCFVNGVATVQDGHGHGTHCAGIICGAVRPSSGPRYSVAPNVELLVAKVLSDAGSGYDHEILSGIQWAAEQGARVISMSLGAPRRPTEPYSTIYERVARNLLTGEPGVLLVAAAGNESDGRRSKWAPVGNPAACPSVMAVSAVDQAGEPAWFACREEDAVGRIDLSGPGVDVHSAWTGGGYKTISGTSMATPHVAAVCALFLELGASPDGKRLWDLATSSCKPLGPRTIFGAGLCQVP